MSFYSQLRWVLRSLEEAEGSLHEVDKRLSCAPFVVDCPARHRDQIHTWAAESTALLLRVREMRRAVRDFKGKEKP